MSDSSLNGGKEPSLDSLPPTVDVDTDLEEQSLGECEDDEYWDSTTKECSQCTTCGPGTQHSVDKRCGHGSGFNQTCEPCSDGYFQSDTSANLVRCSRCITCDALVETIQECSLINNAKCGPCPYGMYYGEENSCYECAKGNPAHKDCPTTVPDLGLITNTPDTKREHTVEPPAQPTQDRPIYVPSPTFPITYPMANISTQRNPTAGGIDWISVGIASAIFLGVLLIVFLAYCFFYLLKKHWAKLCGNPSSNERVHGRNGASCETIVVYTVNEESIRYQGIPQGEPHQDGENDCQPSTATPVGNDPCQQDLAPSAPREANQVGCSSSPEPFPL